MTELRIRNVDEWVVEALRLEARSNGKSLEEALRELLSKEAMRRKQALADELREMRGELKKKYGTFTDSAALIREDRDARG
jgi:antitoxin FitA